MQFIYKVDFSSDMTQIKILSKKDSYKSINKIKGWIINILMKLYFKEELKTRYLKR
jgi:hypothetical protein